MQGWRTHAGTAHTGGHSTEPWASIPEALCQLTVLETWEIPQLPEPLWSQDRLGAPLSTPPSEGFPAGSAHMESLKLLRRAPLLRVGSAGLEPQGGPRALLGCWARSARSDVWPPAPPV